MEDVKPEYISLFITKLRKYLGNRLEDKEVYTLAKDIISHNGYDFPLHCLSEVMVDNGIKTFPENWVKGFGDLVYEDVINKTYERYVYGDGLPKNGWYLPNIHFLIKYYESEEEYEKCLHLNRLIQDHQNNMTRIYQDFFQS